MDAPMARLTDDDTRALVALRHDLHQHPELSGREYRTSERIREYMASLPGCRIIPLPTDTGVVAQIPGSQAEVMLRADVDALPQTERVDIDWRSCAPGVMHACGHDLHATALCGAALLLSRMACEGRALPTIDLVFQPSEENGAGARMLIDAGLFSHIHPGVCFGMHNWPSVEVGNVVCREGALMAALRNFDVVVRGSGGHGSMPHLNADPIVCAAAIIQSLQTVVSRNVDPLVAGLLSINMIEGGSPVNRVADEVLMKATVRSLSDEVLDRMVERIEAIVKGTARAYGCDGEVVWGRRVPMVWNSPEMTQVALECVRMSGLNVVDAMPTLVGEDFSYYREHVPSFFFWVGSRAPGDEVHELHAPDFFADDSAISHAAELYAACAVAN